jgi:hypothetical protein
MIHTISGSVVAGYRFPLFTAGFNKTFSPGWMKLIPPASSTQRWVASRMLEKSRLRTTATELRRGLSGSSGRRCRLARTSSRSVADDAWPPRSPVADLAIVSIDTPINEYRRKRRRPKALGGLDWSLMLDLGARIVVPSSQVNRRLLPRILVFGAAFPLV